MSFEKKKKGRKFDCFHSFEWFNSIKKSKKKINKCSIYKIHYNHTVYQFNSLNVYEIFFVTDHWNLAYESSILQIERNVPAN